MNRLDTNKLILAAENVYGYCPVDDGRRQKHIWARQAVCSKLADHMTLSQIGRVFGQSSSNIVNTIKKFKELSVSDDEYRTYYNRFLVAIGETPTDFVKVSERKKITPEPSKYRPLVDMVMQVPEEIIDSVGIKIGAVIEMAVKVHNAKRNGNG